MVKMICILLYTIEKINTSRIWGKKTNAAAYLVEWKKMVKTNGEFAVQLTKNSRKICYNYDQKMNKKLFTRCNMGGIIIKQCRKDA